jgi:hypothetical protein
LPHGGMDAVRFDVAHDCVAQRELVLARAAHGAVESKTGVGWSLNTSASPGEAPGSHLSFSDEGPDRPAPRRRPVRAFICCLSHWTPRFPNTRSSIIPCFCFPGSESLWVCLKPRPKLHCHAAPASPSLRWKWLARSVFAPPLVSRILPDHSRIYG